jgi:hypothetical protein
MKLETRVERLESETATVARRHVILKADYQTDLEAIDLYGRDRIADGEDIFFVELVALTAADSKGWANDRG